MHDLEWAQDYMEDDTRRTALFKLAEQIFGLRMENWYRHAPANRRYIPFSYFDGGRTIANVSANLLNLVIDGEWKPAVQLGTVMTHPDYRGRGLAGRLMNRVLEYYEGTYDVMYLFANRSVLHFYPKYGFEPVSEQFFILDWSPSKLQLAGEGIGKLDPRNKDDLQFIACMAAARKPVSHVLGAANAEGILMFYCLNVFPDDIHYLEEEKAIVICKRHMTDPARLEIFDIISSVEIDIHRVLSRLAGEEIRTVVFHYTPDYQGIQLRSSMFNGSEVLFVKTNGSVRLPPLIKHPITAQA